MTDEVNHPPHYTSHPSGVECIVVAEHFGFNIGNAVKYLWRSGLKPGVPDVTDLEKAIWYIRREIAKRGVAAKVAPRHADDPNGNGEFASRLMSTDRDYAQGALWVLGD